MAILTVEGLQKSFGNTEVLKNINFSLEKGEVLAIIGSSGSGKTTLLRCLNFLVTPDAGRILIGDEAILDANAGKRMSDSQIRKNRLHFGLVFQQFNLFPQYTVHGNITLAAKLMRKEEWKKLKQIEGKEEWKKLKQTMGKEEWKELKKLKQTEAKEAYREAKARGFADIEEKADALLARVGLSEKAEAYPCELSGGQQQRVAIARALALSPDILCFDEPTSALDPELTGEVLSVIRGLKSGDSTMIVVTHEMEFARNVADRVIFMADGVIEEMGAPEEVFGNPKSEKLRSFLSKTYD